MKRLLPAAAFIAVLFVSAITVQAATILFPSSGGTGTGSIPTYGKVLVGNAGGTYTLTATSSLGISAGGSTASSTLLGDNNTFSGANSFSSLITGSVSGNAGTATKLSSARAINGVNFDGTAAITIFAASSTALANNNTWSGLNVFSTAPTLATLNGLIAGNSGATYAAATSTLSASSPLTGSFTVVGTGGSIGCTTASAGVTGCLSGTDWNTFNNKLSAAITALGPVGQTQTGATQTLATSTSSFNGLTVGLTITGASNTQTFQPTLSGTLGNAGLANSTISGVALGSNLNSLSTNSTLSGTSYNGSATVSNWGINLGNANTWTALQQFTGNASSTQLSVPNQAWFGSTATSTFNSAGSLGIASTSPAFPLSVNNAGSDFYVTSTGKVIGRDTTNSFTGRISPTHSFALTTGTTTAWTASTTATAYSPFAIMPFSGTLKQGYCLTDASFLGVNVQVNGSNATPSYFVASTTSGNITFTAGNTFSKGQKVLMNVGTTTTASALSLSCTFDVTETI